MSMKQSILLKYQYSINKIPLFIIKKNTVLYFRSVEWLCYKYQRDLVVPFILLLFFINCISTVENIPAFHVT